MRKAYVQNSFANVGFEVLTVVTVKHDVLWVVTPNRILISYSFSVNTSKLTKVIN
jgi:hypothetical protein